MSTTTVTLSKDYGLVLAAAGAIGFHIYMTGALKAGGTRRVTFTREWVERLKGTPEGRALIADHAAALGVDAAAAEKAMVGGYPDVGNGRFAATLTHAEWLRFNDGQRAHYNYLEAAPAALTCLLVGGVHAPVLAAAAGATLLVGRELYAQGYVSKGPAGRSAGGALSALSMLTLLGTAVYSTLKVTRVIN